jgi:O-glycosyl hydrolase
MLWRVLKFKTLRLWLNTYEYSPLPGAHDLSVFRRNYVDSGIIADARTFGATTLLLAPDGLPAYMKEQPKKPGGDALLKESEVTNYAILLADFIARLKAETGVQLDATGVQNEPNVTEYFSHLQMVTIVKRLRVELDARGLQAVKIIAPEYASSDGVFYEQVDALKNDAAAWQPSEGFLHTPTTWPRPMTSRAALKAARARTSKSTG